MKNEEEAPNKKADPFQTTWDLMVITPLYALLILAIFAGISILTIWGLGTVTGVEMKLPIP